ncbi:MAG: hypothetical protein ACP5M8_07655 [Caldisphaera sp.]
MSIKFPRSFVKRVKKSGIHPFSLISYIMYRMPTLLVILETASVFVVYLIKIFLPLKLHLRNIIILDEGPIHTLALYIALTSEIKDYLGKEGTKYSEMLISTAIRITSYLLRNAKVKVYYFHYDSPRELIFRTNVRGWPSPLDGVLDYENIINYNKFFDLSKHVLEKTLNMEIIAYDVSKNKITAMLNQIFDESINTETELREG